MNLRFSTRRELRKIFAFGFAFMSVPLMPVITPFLGARGISAGQVLWLISFQSAAIIIFEIPTGYLCDRWGRKQVLLAGSMLNLAAFGMIAIVNGFVALACAQIVLAGGISLVSGSETALIYDHLDQDFSGADASTLSKARRRALAGYQQAATIGEAISAVIGGSLARFSLNDVGWLTVAFATVPVLIAASMRPDPTIHHSTAKAVHDLKAAFATIVQTRRRLIVANITIFNVSTFIAVWLLQPYWKVRDVPLDWFGMFWAGTLITVAAAARSASLFETVIGRRGSLLVIMLFPIAGFLGMSGFAGALGIGSCFLFYVSRGLNFVILGEMFNRTLPAGMRATCNSIANGGYRFIFAACGPFVGASLDHAGIDETLLGLGCVFLGLFFVVGIPLIRLSDTEAF